MTAADDHFERFFRASYPRLVAMGVAMSAPRAVAQELAQEALVRAHRDWDRIRAYDEPHGWARRVMGNLLIDEHRSRTAERGAVTRLRTLKGAGDARPQGADHASAVAASDRWHELTADLTANQRLVVALFYGEDLSVAEVAEELAVSEGTVKSTLSKARRNVRRAVESDGNGRMSGEGEEARS